MNVAAQARRVIGLARNPKRIPVAVSSRLRGPGYYEARTPPEGFPVWPWGRGARRSREAGAACTICLWAGPSFQGPRHVEAQTCPRCGSIVRDRVLIDAMLRNVEPAGGLRVMETSPRLGADYRTAMGQWFHYLPSDWDERAHKGAVKLDLQELRLPDRSLDVVLTAHVLEHVPDTDRALSELYRVLVPGGHLFLQIPLLQGVTAPPKEPEFHGDDTPVFWRFGFDLIDRLRSHGFTTTLLCAQDWYDALARGATEWTEPTDPTWDVPDMLAVGRGRLADHTVQFGRAEAERIGLHHGYMCMTFSCVKA